MTIRLSTGLRNSMLGSEGLTGALDKGVIYIYTGPQPLSADNAATGTVLGIVTVNGGAFSFGSPTNGLGFEAPTAGTLSKAIDELWQFTGLVTGTAGWFRFVGNDTDSGGNSTTLPRIDGSIATSGADMNMSSVSVVAAAPHTVDAFQLALSAS